jgi:ankyrin repeat protein
MCCLKDQEPDPWKERQQRLEVFDFCFRPGAQLSTGSPLSVLIYAGGRTKLIQELLDKGAKVNAYSHDMESEFPKLPEPWCLSPLQAAALCGNEVIVNELRERGADVNAPALGRLGKTALQNICAWIPSTFEERARKNRIFHRLLEQGADVNAAPAECCGRTALQVASAEGELELVLLLLDWGAGVNAPPCPRQGGLLWMALLSKTGWMLSNCC